MPREYATVVYVSEESAGMPGGCWKEGRLRHGRVCDGESRGAYRYTILERRICAGRSRRGALLCLPIDMGCMGLICRGKIGTSVARQFHSLLLLPMHVKYPEESEM